MTTPAERASSYMYGFPWPIWIVQTLGIAGVACSAWFIAKLLQQKPRTLLPWLCAAVLTVYSAWLWHWRLLGYWF